MFRDDIYPVVVSIFLFPTPRHFGCVLFSVLFSFLLVVDRLKEKEKTKFLFSSLKFLWPVKGKSVLCFYFFFILFYFFSLGHFAAKSNEKEKRVARAQRENTSSGGNSCELLIRLIALYIYRENGYAAPLSFSVPSRPSISTREFVQCVWFSAVFFSFFFLPILVIIELK